MQDKFYLVADFTVKIKADPALVGEGVVQMGPTPTSCSVDDQRLKAIITELVTDRFELANQLLRYIRDLDPTDPVAARQIVSRGYYAMYHASRACLLADEQNDLVGFGPRSHSEVPERMRRLDDESVMPPIRSTLNTWRTLRNAADYDVYVFPNPRAVERDVLNSAGFAAQLVQSFLVKCAKIVEERGIHVVAA